jgi:hypothetical protein
MHINQPGEFFRQAVIIQPQFHQGIETNIGEKRVCPLQQFEENIDSFLGF